MWEAGQGEVTLTGDELSYGDASNVAGDVLVGNFSPGEGSDIAFVSFHAVLYQMSLQWTCLQRRIVT